MFSPAGRADPQVILRSSPLPGCQYPFVRDVLRDPRFAAASIPPSADPAFQLLARWMIRLDGDRHRRVRDTFGGLFTLGTHLLCTHPEALAALQEDPDAGPPPSRKCCG